MSKVDKTYVTQTIQNNKIYSREWRGGIKNIDAGSLEIWIGHRDKRFVEDGRFWAGKDMGLLY